METQPFRRPVVSFSTIGQPSPELARRLLVYLPSDCQPLLSRHVRFINGLAVEAAAQLSSLGGASLAAAAAVSIPAARPSGIVWLVSQRTAAVSAGQFVLRLASAVLLDPVFLLCALVERGQQGPPSLLFVRDNSQPQRRQRYQDRDRRCHGRR